MDIPLLSKEEIEKEDIEEGDKDIRDQLIEFLIGKGYKHLSADQTFGDETADFFTKDEQLIEIIVNDDIPEDILEQMTETDTE